MMQLSIFDSTNQSESGIPPLPERVLCVSLWMPYAELVVCGVKTIETRTWPWPYPPSWLVIHEAKHTDRAAESRLRSRIVSMREQRSLSEPRVGCGGAAIGMVYVKGCRPLEPRDEEAACFYASSPPRHAWLLGHPSVFRQPVTMRGPQKFIYLPRETVLAAL